MRLSACRNLAVFHASPSAIWQQQGHWAFWSVRRSRRPSPQTISLKTTNGVPAFHKRPAMQRHGSSVRRRRRSEAGGGRAKTELMRIRQEISLPGFASVGMIRVALHWASGIPVALAGVSQQLCWFGVFTHPRPPRNLHLRDTRHSSETRAGQ